MRTLPFLLAAVLVTAAAAAAPDGYEARGDALEGAVEPGEGFPVSSLTSLSGEEVRVPDPTGRYVILELIRSADW